MNKKPKDINEYITGFPRGIQKILETVRSTIKKAAPDAVETISYAIPEFSYNGKLLIFFAGYKKHISIYPAPRSHESFKKILSAYKGGKGTVQFPFDKPIPFTLIIKIVKFRLKKAKEKIKIKKQ
jgi:uncharacterized protein YdhG (YjbR/CyaY superfamily)